jgi:restriction system protein
MRNYWLVRVGQANKYAAQAKSENCIALGWTEVDKDLSPFIKLEKKEFVQSISPLLKEAFPDRTPKYWEGSARQLYKLSSLMKIDDIVFVPNEKSSTIDIARVTSGYYYDTGSNELPYRHRRDVEWIISIDKNSLSTPFQNSVGSILTLFSLNSYSEDIEAILGKLVPTAGSIEESIKTFGLESHLEDFIVSNWRSIPEFSDYDIHVEDDEVVGKQYVTDIGRIDILARSKIDKSWLVVELKKGHTSDDVVGQVLRYIGWVMENEANEGEEVKGLIIASKNDDKLRLALKTVPHVSYLTYEVNFALRKPSF